MFSFFSSFLANVQISLSSLFKSAFSGSQDWDRIPLSYALEEPVIILYIPFIKLWLFGSWLLTLAFCLFVYACVLHWTTLW